VGTDSSPVASQRNQKEKTPLLKSKFFSCSSLYLFTSANYHQVQFKNSIYSNIKPLIVYGA
jgi:hypothetical protein